MSRKTWQVLGAVIAAMLMLCAACSATSEVAGVPDRESAEPPRSTDGPEPPPATANPVPSDDDPADDAPSEDGPSEDDSSEDGPAEQAPTNPAPREQEPREVPPLVLAADAPGTDEAYEQMIDELDRFITPEQRAAGVPWPDSRNPDPVAAYQSSATFQNWMSENNVTPSLVEAYTAPNSPERGWDLDLFGLYSARGVLSTPSDPPYSMRVDDLVHPAATGITDALLAQVPEGSAAVVYWDSAGRSQLVRPDGTILSDDPGWTDLGPWVAIMAPTDVGWQVWFDELTDPPPPGDDDDRGLPQPGPDRQDV